MGAVLFPFPFSPFPVSSDNLHRSSEKWIRPPLMSNSGFGPVSGVDDGVVRQGKKRVVDVPQERFGIPPWQIGSTDRPREQRVPDEGHSVTNERHSSRAVPWDALYAEGKAAD